MKRVLLVASFLISDFAFAQIPPSIEWQNTMGGNNFDYLRFARQTSDEGYIFSGHSASNNANVSGNHGLQDYWIVKTNSIGMIQWQKCFGGTSYDWAFSIRQTFDNGYIVAGYTESNDGNVTGNHGDADYWLVKTDSSGNLQWQKCFGGTGNDMAYSVQQTSEGGYIVAGCTWSYDGDVTGNHGNNDYWIIKTDSAGNLQWQKCFGGSDLDEAYSVAQTFDGGYIVAGYSMSVDGDVAGNHGNKDYWLIKCDVSGNLQWQRCLGGTGEDMAWSVHQTSDNLYIVTGTTFSNDGDVTGNHGNQDYWLVKIDNNPNLLWQKCFGGSGYDLAYSVDQASDNGCIIAGSSNSNDGDVTGNHGNDDYWLVKTDSVGSLEWQRCLGGANFDNGYHVQQTSDGGYIAGGFSNSGISGDKTENCMGQMDYWVIKLAPDTIMSTFIIHNSALSIQLNPNPANELIVINYQFAAGDIIRIIDVSGRNLFLKTFSVLTDNYRLTTDRFGNGIYFVEVAGNNFSVTKKLIIAR